MSDLEKTLQDMDKTEVGEYRHGRGHFPTEDDGGRANVEVLQALCPNPGATALESVVWAADLIESLEIFRRDAKVENAELHSQIDSLQRENEKLSGQLKGLHLYYEGHEAQMEELRAAAITPEMREKVAAAIQLYEMLPPVPGPRGTEFAPTAYSIFRDLLGEQG